ncbi:MAG: XRE family transcriptional regulator [Bryobacterales bacterium]|nr:XRE family transcriptional regulator [Bryobacterales bacterium]
MTVRARVKPEMIRWVREDADLSIEDAARKAQVRESAVRDWEAGTSQPTIRQLPLLGNAAGRPLAIFFLAEPPWNFTALSDFRSLPGTLADDHSPALRLAVRRALERREVALDLAAELNEDIPELAISATLGEPVGDVARRVRAFLGVSESEQRHWHRPYDSLNGWQRAVEARGVLVFQASGIDIAEARGFSATEQPLPVIVLNVRDAPNGRVFALLHELCHVLLRNGGFCDLRDRAWDVPEQNPIEVFCNAVAGETLVPTDALASSRAVRAIPAGMNWSASGIRALAQEFSVSRQVALRRLLDAGRITLDGYRSHIDAMLKARHQRTDSRQTGFIPPATKVVSGLGRPFIRWVLSSYYQERITLRDVAAHLGVRLKHMAKIEKTVMGRPVMFG